MPAAESTAAPAAGSERVAIALLASAVVIWGCTPRVTAIAGDYTEPLTLTTMRAAPTALFLLAALPLLRYRLPRGRAVWIPVATSGVLMVTVFLGAFTEAIIRSGPGNAIVLGSTSPFFIVGFARIRYGEPVPRRSLIGMIVGFAGVVLVAWSQLGGSSGAGDMAIGLACALAASLGWAGGTLIVKQLLTDHPDTDLIGLTTGQYLAGGIVLVVVSAIVEGTGGTEWGQPRLWLAVAFISIVGSALATIGYLAALRRISASRASTWLFLSPVVAVLVEIARGDVPEAVVLLGMATTIAGVALVTIAPRRARTP